MTFYHSFNRSWDSHFYSFWEPWWSRYHKCPAYFWAIGLLLYLLYRSRSSSTIFRIVIKEPFILFGIKITSVFLDMFMSKTQMGMNTLMHLSQFLSPALSEHPAVFSCLHNTDKSDMGNSLSTKFWVKLCRKHYCDFQNIPFHMWIYTGLSFSQGSTTLKDNSVLFRVYTLTCCAVLIRIWINDFFSHQ